MDTKTRIENLKTLARAIGPGFHPDTYGEAYTSLPEGFDADAVDVIVDMAFADPDIDPYAVALEALSEA